MLTLTLIQAVISAILYMIFYAVLWKKSRNRKDRPLSDRSYGIGFLFAFLFYYGLPIWIWRYGLLVAVGLIAACSITAIGASIMLGLIMSIDPFSLGLLLPMLVRVVAGGLLAKYDKKLVQRISFVRSKRKSVEK